MGCFWAYENHSNQLLSYYLSPGFNTAKGELVNAIMYPKPLDFEFYRDAIRFIMFLSVVASSGMIYSLVTYITNHVSKTDKMLQYLGCQAHPLWPAQKTINDWTKASILKC